MDEGRPDEGEAVVMLQAVHHTVQEPEQENIISGNNLS